MAYTYPQPNSPYLTVPNPAYDPRQPAVVPASPYVGHAMSPYAPLSPLGSPWCSPHASPSNVTVQLPPTMMPAPTSVTIVSPPQLYASPAYYAAPLPPSPAPSAHWNESAIRGMLKDLDKDIKATQGEYDTLVSVLGSLDGAARMSAYTDLKTKKDALDKLKKKRAQYEPWRKMFPHLDLSLDD
jgi:hypothetical protein